MMVKPSALTLSQGRTMGCICLRDCGGSWITFHLGLLVSCWRLMNMRKVITSVNINSLKTSRRLMIHPLSDIKTDNIGEGTDVWQFSVILEKATIGNHCNIYAHVFIENDVVLGDYVTVKSGAQLWDGLRIHDHVFIGPNVTFTNDENPRSKQYPDQFQRTIIHHHASIGAGAIILGGNDI